MKKHLNLLLFFFFNFFWSQNIEKLSSTINKDLTTFESTNTVKLIDKEELENEKIFSYFYELNSEYKKLIRVYTTNDKIIKKIVWFEENNFSESWAQNNLNLIDSKKFKYCILRTEKSEPEKSKIYKKRINKIVGNFKTNKNSKFQYISLFSNNNVIIYTFLTKNNYLTIISDNEIFKKEESPTLYKFLLENGITK